MRHLPHDETKGIETENFCKEKLIKSHNENVYYNFILTLCHVFFSDFHILIYYEM